MKGAIFALGIGAVVSSAAAPIGFASFEAGHVVPVPAPYEPTAASLASAARLTQKARIEARYEVQRARCDALRGAEHDRCLIDAHAARGRWLLEAAAPYQQRS